LVFTHLQFEDAGSYQLAASNRVNTRHSSEIQVKVSGAVSELDPNFVVDPRISILRPGQPGGFSAALPDGKLLIHARYQIDQKYERGIVRLSADGSLDETFPLTPLRAIYDAAAAADGTVYGRFDCDGCSAEQHPFGRRLPNGDIETFPTPEGFEESAKTAMAIQPMDGKILRTLRSSDDPLRTSLLRFHPDGQLDTSFTPVHFGQAAKVHAVVLLDSGKVLVGGQWGLVRLNADGSADDSFVSLASGDDFTNVVQLVKVGDRVVASNGYAIKMMDGEGDLDTAFEFEITQARFDEISMDLAGRIYIDRQSPELHLRLHPNGAPDRTLPMDVSPYDYQDETTTFRPHLDGMLVFNLSGFSYYGGMILSNYIARLRPVGSVLVQRKWGFWGRSLEGFWRRSGCSFCRWRGIGKF
jgi:hypothetical protein